jgi:hypothetical protein
MHRLLEGIFEFQARDLIDVDGRPCGEQASRHFDTVNTQLIACPHPGARHGKPMNLSALQPLTQVWREVVGTVSALVGPGGTHGVTVHGAYQAAIACTAAPLIFQIQHPDQAIPRTLSALFKAALGFSQTLSFLLLADDGVADAPLSELGDEAQFAAYLENQQWLVGQSQVCAGSPAMIGQLFAAFCGQSPGGELAPEFPSGRVWIDAVVALIGLQMTYLLMLNTRAAQGQSVQGASHANWQTQPHAPWLRTVAMQPGRTPAHAKRLFPSGCVTEPVMQMIADHAQEWDGIESIFTHAVHQQLILINPVPSF